MVLAQFGCQIVNRPGGQDGDMVNRAQLLGLEIAWVERDTFMLHQWHPRKHQGLSRPEEIRQAQRAWRANHELVRRRASTARRNPQGWGGEA